MSANNSVPQRALSESFVVEEVPAAALLAAAADLRISQNLADVELLSSSGGPGLSGGLGAVGGDSGAGAGLGSSGALRDSTLTVGAPSHHHGANSMVGQGHASSSGHDEVGSRDFVNLPISSTGSLGLPSLPPASPAALRPAAMTNAPAAEIMVRVPSIVLTESAGDVRGSQNSTFGGSGAVGSEGGDENALVPVRFVSLSNVAGGGAADRANDGLSVDTSQNSIAADRPGSPNRSWSSSRGVFLRSGGVARGSLDLGSSPAVVDGEVPVVVLSQVNADRFQSDSHDTLEESGSLLSSTTLVAVMPLETARGALAELHRRGANNSKTLGFLFLLLFIPFNSLQGYIIQIDVDLGAAVLASYYGMGVVAAVFTGPFLARFSVVNVLRASFVPFTMMLGSMIYPVFWVVVISSAFAGFAGGPLWIGQGLYIGLNSDPATLAPNNGFFSMFYSLNYVISALLTGVLLNAVDISFSNLFLGGAVIGAFASVGTYWLRPPALVVPANKPVIDTTNDVALLQVSSPLSFSRDDRDSSSDNDDSSDSEGEGDGLLSSSLSSRPQFGALDVSDGINEPEETPLRQPPFMTLVGRETIKLVQYCGQRSLQRFMILYFWNGLFYAYVSGPIGALIPVKQVGWGLGLYGLSTTISAYTFAKLGQRSPPMFTHQQQVLVTAALQAFNLAAVMTVALTTDETQVEIRLPVIFVIYALSGFVDGGMYPALIAMCVEATPTDRPAGLTIARVFRSAANVLSFLSMSFVKFRAIELGIIQACLLAMGVFTMCKLQPTRGGISENLIRTAS